jgi:peptide/nickel transport system ATP-binding protein
MEPPLFEIQNLRAYIPSKKGPIKVVNDVSLTIKDQECVGLLGESGCGKTSLVLAALGHFSSIHKFRSVKTEGTHITTQPTISPDEWNETVTGKAIYKGIDILALPQEERARYWGRHVSFVPQGLQGALNPIFSIGLQTGEGLEIHEGISSGQSMLTRGQIRQAKMRNRVLEYLNLVNLADAANRYVLDPNSFSGGEAQRILIATALITAPYLVIADEPTSALDVTVQAQILNVLRMVRDEFNVSLLLISHNAAVIAEMADRVAIMYAGRIMEVGEAVRMFHDPGHPYSQGLMSSFPTIMMMQRKAGKRPRLRGIPGAPPDLTNLPTACPFHPRCNHVQDICKNEVPELRNVESNHQVACHLYEELK